MNVISVEVVGRCLVHLVQLRHVINALNNTLMSVFFLSKVAVHVLPHAFAPRPRQQRCARNRFWYRHCRFGLRSDSPGRLRPLVEGQLPCAATCGLLIVLNPNRWIASPQPSIMTAENDRRTVMTFHDMS